jgi:hypothetical protein
MARSVELGELVDCAETDMHSVVQADADFQLLAEWWQYYFGVSVNVMSEDELAFAAWRVLEQKSGNSYESTKAATEAYLVGHMDPGHVWYNRHCALLSRSLVSGAVLEGTRTEESTVVPTEPVAAQQVVPASSPPCTIAMEMDVVAEA